MSRRAVGRLLLAGLTVVSLGIPVSLVAKGGVYSHTKHADPTTGAFRDADYQRGECSQCHVQHDGSAPNAFALFAPNANSLCYTSGCHSATSANAIFQGQALYEATLHATRTSMVWPGPDGSVDPAAPAARPSGDWGKCVNCHDPHGYNMDGTGLIPSLVVSREEKLCYVCHDGSPASQNVRGEFAKAYVHPIATSGKHSAAEGGSPSAYGATPTNNRHAECADCHNPHVARSDIPAPTPPDASNRLRGVGRVSVINGAAGAVPSYVYKGPADTTPPIAEYEVCFKCHSSWTTPPTGQTNLPVLFNPNNPSYHPVEAAGKNTNINANAFVNGWLPTRMTYCTDCHSSDNTAIRGAHGSVYRYIVRKAATGGNGTAAASSNQRTMASTELCFDCHRYDTYANDGASNTVTGYSRFNPPGFRQGHAYHVGNRQYPCYACHDSHGSTTKPTLIVTGRNPGLNSYTQTPGGGTCAPTCHGTKTYTINYPR